MTQRRPRRPIPVWVSLLAGILLTVLTTGAWVYMHGPEGLIVFLTGTGGLLASALLEGRSG